MPRTRCPHCRWKGEVDEELIGVEVLCPECEEAFTCKRLKKKTGAKKIPRSFSTARTGRRTGGCDEIDYQLHGDDLPLLEVILDQGETVIAEAGAMVYMARGIAFDTKMGDGSDPGAGLWDSLKKAGARAVAGESVFLTHFTNRSRERRTVSFASSMPGHILPIDLGKHGVIRCERGAFLAAAKGTQINVAFAGAGAGFLGGEGFVLQELRGNGMAFVHAGGTLVERELNNDEIRVDTGCIVGFTKGIKYDIQRAGGLRSMAFGGEGLFLATLSGTGTVWLQSMPSQRLAATLLSLMPPSRR